MAENNYSYRAYSMEYGTFVGLGWGALFLCYVGGICTGNALLIFLCLLLFPVCMVLPFMLALRLNRKFAKAQIRLKYMYGLLFSASMLMYACLLTGLTEFAYFAHFDDGTLITQLSLMLSQPEAVATYHQLGMSESYTQLTDMLQEIDAMTPFEKALSLFNSHFLSSMFLSPFVAIVASWNLKKKPQQQ